MIQLKFPRFLRHAFVLALLQNATTLTTGFHPTYSPSKLSSVCMPLQYITTALFAETNDATSESVGEEKQDKAIQAKQALFQSFREEDNDSDKFQLHKPTKERSALVAELIKTNPTPSPGSTKSFRSLAPGIWRIVYAPHIATFGMVTTKLLSALLSLSPLFNNSIGKENSGDNNKKEIGHRNFSLGFDPVYYLLRPDGTMTSHARLVVTYPSQKKSVTWFSVAGTYSSQDEDRICRVDFDEAWVQTSENYEDDPSTLKPYASLEQVPDGLAKNVINVLGRFFFIDAVSVFPVSYLDDDCIVFDFELLGTRILAKKVHKLVGNNESDDVILQFLAGEER